MQSAVELLNQRFDSIEARCEVIQTSAMEASVVQTIAAVTAAVSSNAAPSMALAAPNTGMADPKAIDAAEVLDNASPFAAKPQHGLMLAKVVADANARALNTAASGALKKPCSLPKVCRGCRRCLVLH